MNLLNRLIREEEGQDIIEYVLIAAAISVIAIPIIPGIGTAVSNAWNNVNTQVRRIPGRRLVACPRRRRATCRSAAFLRHSLSREVHSTCGHCLSVSSRDERGQDIIEYVLLTAGIGVVGDRHVAAHRDGDCARRIRRWTPIRRISGSRPTPEAVHDDFETGGASPSAVAACVTDVAVSPRAERADRDGDRGGTAGARHAAGRPRRARRARSGWPWVWRCSFRSSPWAAWAAAT